MNKVKLISKKYGFSMMVPDNLMEVKKDSFKKLNISSNTIFAFSLNKDTSLYVNFSGLAKDFAKQIEGTTKDLNLLDKDFSRYKDIYMEASGKKILISFVKVNDLIISFSINLDPYKEVFDNKLLKNLDEVALVHEMIDSIKLFKREDVLFIKREEKEEEVPLKEEENSLPKDLIIKDAFYLGIMEPSFYLKMEEKDNFLRCINDEVYLSIKDERPLYIKDKETASSIKSELIKHMEALDKLETNNPKNMILAKVDDRYYLGENDLDNPEIASLKEALLNMFSKEYLSNTKEEEEKIEEKPHIEPLYEAYNMEDEIEVSDIELPKEEVEEPIIEDTSSEDIPLIIYPEEEPALKIEEEEIPKEEAPVLEDAFHINHYLSEGFALSLSLPHNYTNKVVYDENVFDMLDKEEKAFRIFIYPCKTDVLYKEKLNDWMNKNALSMEEEISEKSRKEINNINVDIFVIGNTFYVSRYVNNYLVAISSINTAYNMDDAIASLVTLEAKVIPKEEVEKLIRREKSLDLIRGLNLPYIYDDIIDVDQKKNHLKNVDDIVRRIFAMTMSANYASDLAREGAKRHQKASKKVFMKEINKYGLKNYLSDEEERLFKKGDLDLAINVSWHFEAVNVLLWALGLLKEYPRFDYPSDADNTTSIVFSYRSVSHMISASKMRLKEEILDAYDYILRLYLYALEMHNHDEEISELIDEEVLMEQLAALIYLITDKSWDRINIGEAI